MIEVFGARGAPAFLNLTAALPRLRELTAELRNSAGSAAELQRVMDDTLAGAFRRIVSAAEGFGIALATTSGLGAGLQSTLDATSAHVNRLTDNIEQFLAALRDAAAVGALFLSGRFVAQAIAAAGALRGLSIAAVAARVGLAAFTGPLGLLVIAATSLGVYALRTREAAEATSEFARETERFLERGVVDQVDVLRGAVARYERQIVRLREQLNQPLSLQGRFNLRAQIGQFEEELRDFRIRLRDAQQSAVSLPPVTTAALTPETAGGAAAGTSRNLGADISAEIERAERVARQRIEILRAEGQERLKLEARYAITNQLVDEQLRLSAALVAAKDKERAQLVAEQQALDRTVAGVDALIAAKERQLRLDQQVIDVTERLQAEEQNAQDITDAFARSQLDLERLGRLCSNAVSLCRRDKCRVARNS